MTDERHHYTLDEDADMPTPAPERWLPVREAIAALLIVGVLLGIAIPLAVDQRKKAVDSQVKADLTAVEQAITEWIAANDELPSMTVDGVLVYLDDVQVAAIDEDTTLSELDGDSTAAWCLTATNPAGKHAADPGYRYKASNEKIDTGVC